MRAGSGPTAEYLSRDPGLYVSVGGVPADRQDRLTRATRWVMGLGSPLPAKYRHPALWFGEPVWPFAPSVRLLAVDQEGGVRPPGFASARLLRRHDRRQLNVKELALGGF